jgi:hypothetical protein
MGWTQTYREKGMTTEAFFRREFGSLADGFIAVSAPKTTETYIAYRRPNGEVTALVIMTAWYRGAQYNFGYKEMDESAGPGIDNCPRSILELLTDPPNEYARKWRERAWDHIRYRASRTQRINTRQLPA